VTLDQLRVFVAVAVRQHVTHAAQALNVAQSAASNAIASLEARHKTKLFNRIGRHIELADAGQAFFEGGTRRPCCRRRCRTCAHGFRRFEARRASVQASHTVANYWSPRHLAIFRRAYLEIEVRMSIGNTAQVAIAVERRAVELGFVEAAIHTEQVNSITVARDQVIVVANPEHGVVKRKSIAPRDLLDVEWVLRERGSGTRAVFEDALVQSGLDVHTLRVAMELPSNEAVRAAVESGLGVTAISASVAAVWRLDSWSESTFACPSANFTCCNIEIGSPARRHRLF
jgi:DNA-binding transcriptional LysR family regulator